MKGNVLDSICTIFMEHNLDFWHKRTIYHFDPYSVFLAIATFTFMHLADAFIQSDSGYTFLFLSVCYEYTRAT